MVAYAFAAFCAKTAWQDSAEGKDVERGTQALTAGYATPLASFVDLFVSSTRDVDRQEDARRRPLQKSQSSG